MTTFLKPLAIAATLIAILTPAKAETCNSDWCKFNGRLTEYSVLADGKFSLVLEVTNDTGRDFVNSDWTCIYDADARRYGLQMNNQPWGRDGDNLTVGATPAHSGITHRFVSTRFRAGEPVLCYAYVARGAR
jgi:hypothetical protein